jgi:sec-independent protein translocase protein TatC
MTTSDVRQPMMGHLKELRNRLGKSAVAVVVGAAIAYLIRDGFELGGFAVPGLWDLLVAPYEEVFPSNELTSIKVAEQFSVLLRIIVFGGFLIASPYLFAQAWGFVSPALSKKERRWTIPIVAALFSLFPAGVAFAYWLLPRVLELLGSFLEVDVQTTVSDYVGFFLRFVFIFGLTFEFPVFLFAAGAAGIVTSAQLVQARRWAVLIIVIVAAAVTPTGDAYTLFFLAGPLYALYEITLLLIRFVLRK